MFLFRRWNIASHRSLESSLKGIQSPPTMFRTAKFLLSPSSYRWSKTQLQYVTNILHHDNPNSFFRTVTLTFTKFQTCYLSWRRNSIVERKKAHQLGGFSAKGIMSLHRPSRMPFADGHSWERCFFLTCKTNPPWWCRVRDPNMQLVFFFLWWICSKRRYASKNRNTFLFITHF